MTSEQASDIAISGLQYIAGDEAELSRFISMTGIAPEDLRNLASTEDFLAAVLDYLMGNEPTLLAFSAQSGIDPNTIKPARLTLSPQDETGMF